MQKSCLVCGNIFSKKSVESKAYWETKKFCSRKCSLTTTGVQLKENPWKGKHMPEEIKNKISLACKGRPSNSGSFKEGSIPWTKGKKFPERSGKNHPTWNKTEVEYFFCKKVLLRSQWEIKKIQHHFCNRSCWALGTRGKGSPVFLGELATKPLRLRVMELLEYKEWHRFILKRDGFKCVQCLRGRSIGNELEVDHIKRFRSIVIESKIKTTDDARNCKELWDTNNGRTLCKECHRKTDTYGTKNLSKFKKSKL